MADSPAHTRRTEILRTANDVIAVSGLRASLQQIADAAGILAGSLYHHFESKEAILAELTRWYHADLDRIGERALDGPDEPDSREIEKQILALGRAIAACAVTHRAALQMSFYEGPSADPSLAALTRRRPDGIQSAMRQLLGAGQCSGLIRPEIDLTTVADRICQSLLHVGLDMIRHKAGSDEVAALMCQIYLRGLATGEPSDTDLNRSAAFAAAGEVIKSWTDSAPPDVGSKALHVRAAARSEFGKRGYEMTTIRDIAAAAGIGIGTVYRVIGSKDELLTSIMMEFGHKVGDGWTEVLRSDSGPLAKVDALSWLNINALDKYADEFRIQLAWMRQSPPDIADPGWSFTTRVRQTKAMLSAGVRSGEIRMAGPNAEAMARCVIGVQWIPENILAELGTDRALSHSRATMIRGVAVRP